ncbi:MAG: hypothetical protein FWD72_06445, partial [Eggerthellaceae bacterium]|nr:hypothetical protein [Eggerthellaceae bacterium]
MDEGFDAGDADVGSIDTGGFDVGSDTDVGADGADFGEAPEATEATDATDVPGDGGLNFDNAPIIEEGFDFDTADLEAKSFESPDTNIPEADIASLEDVQATNEASLEAFESDSDAIEPQDMSTADVASTESELAEIQQEAETLEPFSFDQLEVEEDPPALDTYKEPAFEAPQDAISGTGKTEPMLDQAEVESMPNDIDSVEESAAEVPQADVVEASAVEKANSLPNDTGAVELDETSIDTPVSGQEVGGLEEPANMLDVQQLEQ